MPESNMVVSGDCKTAQDSAPKAQKKCGWLVPVAVTAAVISLPLLLWQLLKRKPSKGWLTCTAISLCLSMGFLILRRVSTSKDNAGADTSQKPSATASKPATATPKPSTVKDTDANAKTEEGTKKYGRFTVKFGDTEVLVTDTKQKVEPYRFKIASKPWEFVLTLLKNHATGTDQICLSNRDWVGAFQSRNKVPFRFYNEQIFKLPRWDVSKKRYLNKQFAGRWRIWMDSELSLSKDERVKRFKESHPRGYPS